MATSGETEIFGDEERLICSLCLVERGQYTCPRCNIRYCSSVCYKSQAHAECSESFYKDCFMQGLKEINATDEERSKMLEMLQRFEDGEGETDESEDEDAADTDLETRMKGLDLDNDADIMWDRLTKAEKAEFQDMLKDGRLGNLVELWEPWWKEKKTNLIEEVGTEKKNKEKAKHPSVMKNIADIGTILKNSLPSDQMPYILCGVLYGYAYVTRLHNGEHMEGASQAAQDVQTLLSGLTQTTPSSVSEALHGCMTCLQTKENELFVSGQYQIAVIEDVRCIVESDRSSSPLKYMMSALSDLHRLLKTGRKQLEKDLKEAQSRKKNTEVAALKDIRQQCFASMKRVEFLLSWVVKYGRSMRDVLIDVDLEFCALSSELSSHQNDKKRLEQSWGGKQPKKSVRFIEEIADR